MPSSPTYKRDLAQEYKTSKARGDAKARARRNKARRAALKAGKVHKGDGMDVDHTKRRAKGSTRVITASANRAHGGRVGNRAGKAKGARVGHRSRGK